MKRKGKLFLIIVFLLSITSCIKEKAEELAEKATTFEDIKVPENFDYAATKNVIVQVKVNDPEILTAYKYVVKIYSADPDEGGKLIVTGAVNTVDYTYSPTVTVLSDISQVWVEIFLGNDLVQQGYQSF